MEYLSDYQGLCSDFAYAQSGLGLCLLHIPHCWKSHVTPHQYSSIVAEVVKNLRKFQFIMISLSFFLLQDLVIPPRLDVHITHCWKSHVLPHLYVNLCESYKQSSLKSQENVNKTCADPKFCQRGSNFDKFFFSFFLV